MALKVAVESLEGIPEELQPLYVEQDGKFLLDIEGAADLGALKLQLHKERQNRTKADQVIKQLKEQLDGVDFEELRRLQEEDHKRKDGKLLEAGKVEELVTERIKRVQDEFGKTKTALEGERAILKERLNQLSLDNEVARLAPSADFAPQFTAYITWLARQTFRPDEQGIQRAYSGDAQLFSAEDATQPLTIKEWLADLAKREPHLLKPSQGAPAQPTGQRGGTNALTKPVREWTQSQKDEYIAEHGADEFGERVMREALAAQRRIH